MRTEDIINKVFARSFMGYDIEQVDFFLDEVIERFEQYESEKKEMLIAMEYLLNKLENNQNLPIAEMRKAIDTGKTQKNNSAQNNCSKETAQVPSVPKKRETEPEKTKPARSIARGAQPPKPMRAPKISRMRTEQEQPEPGTKKEATMAQKRITNATQAKQDAGASATIIDAPAAENWLDELLMNLIEREKAGYGEPLKGAETPRCDNGDIDSAHAAQDAAAANEARADEPEREPSAVEEEPR